MYRSADGTCRFCGRGEYSSEGTECHVCPEHTTPNYGLFFTNWDQMPSQLWTTCEYLASEDGDACDVKPSWIARGDRIETAPTRAVGVALELSLNLTTGFYNPLRANTGKASEENPIGWISFDLELTCADDSCLLYFVEVTMDKAAKRSFFRFLAAFNGTQKRQQFHYPVVRDRPGRFVFAFTRSGAGVGSDVITDKAVVYSLNITHTGDPETKRHFGGADSCLPCPSFDAVTGECRPCPSGHYIDAGDNRCIKCPPGTALNLTSSQVGPQSCVPCGPNLDSDDRTTCGFNGKLTLPSDGNRTMKFDFSALRNKTLSADGVKVFAREGNSYFHRFNASLFGEPLLCHEDYNIQLLDFTYGRPAEEPGENAAVFCRATMIPTGGEVVPPMSAKNNGTKKGSSGVQTAMPMSAFSIAQKLAAVTLDRTFRGFHLSDALLEYESSSPSATRPIDVHFFFEPTVKHAANCKNGTIGVVTARCQPTAGKLPEVRLSRACPDGTCDGCLYHMFVETSYACPVCNPEDFEEIRGECVGGYQKIHSIPFKHCTALMDKSIERTERCTASGDVRFLLFVAAFVIALLVMVIVIIYMKNKSLEHRYMRIIEGKEPEDLNSCGLESEDDEDFEEEDTQKTRVFFGKKKNDYVAGISKTSRLKKPPTAKGIVGESERTEFLSDSLSD